MKVIYKEVHGSQTQTAHFVVAFCARIQVIEATLVHEKKMQRILNEVHVFIVIGYRLDSRNFNLIN